MLCCAVRVALGETEIGICSLSASHVFGDARIEPIRRLDNWHPALEWLSVGQRRKQTHLPRAENQNTPAIAQS